MSLYVKGEKVTYAVYVKGVLVEGNLSFAAANRLKEAHREDAYVKPSIDLEKVLTKPAALAK